MNIKNLRIKGEKIVKKKFLLDTNILMRSPNSIYVFDDNDVLICDTTLEELDDLKTKPGETSFTAREVIRVLNKLRENGHNLYDGRRGRKGYCA